MSSHAMQANELADKITATAEEALYGIERTTATWPAGFRAIMWDAVALIATQRANLARRMEKTEQ